MLRETIAEPTGSNAAFLATWNQVGPQLLSEPRIEPVMIVEGKPYAILWFRRLLGPASAGSKGAFLRFQGSLTCKAACQGE